MIAWDGAPVEPVPAGALERIRATVLAAAERRHARAIADRCDGCGATTRRCDQAPAQGGIKCCPDCTHGRQL